MINKDRIKAAVLSNKVKFISGITGSIVIIVVIILIVLIIKPKDNSTEISSENNKKNKVALETTTKKNKEKSEEETTTISLISGDTKATEVTSTQKQAVTVASTTVASTVKSTTSATVSPTTVAPTTVTPPTTVAPTTVVQTTEVSTAKTYYYNGREVSELEYKIQTNPLNENAPAGSTLTWGSDEWGFSYVLKMPLFNVVEGFFESAENYVVMENYKGTTVIDAFYYWFIIYSDNSYEVKLKPENSYNTNHK